MNRITIVLQDKQTIMDLASNPEVQLKIKDAVIDGIGRRAIKIGNVATQIIEACSKTIRDEFLTNSYNPTLRREYEKIVKDTVEKEIRGIIRDEIREQLTPVTRRIEDEIGNFKRNAKKYLEDYDFDKAIREIADQEIRRRFSK